jgi:hypothetical protein
LIKSQNEIIALDLRCIKTFPTCSLFEPVPPVFRGSHYAKKGSILDADADGHERDRRFVLAKGKIRVRGS